MGRIITMFVGFKEHEAMSNSFIVIKGHEGDSSRVSNERTVEIVKQRCIAKEK